MSVIRPPSHDENALDPLAYIRKCLNRLGTGYSLDYSAFTHDSFLHAAALPLTNGTDFAPCDGFHDAEAGVGASLLLPS